MDAETVSLSEAIKSYLEELKEKVKEGMKALAKLGAVLEKSDDPQDLIVLMLQYGSPCQVEKTARLYNTVVSKLNILRYALIKHKLLDGKGEEFEIREELRDISDIHCTVADIERLAIAIENNDHYLFFDTLANITDNKTVARLFTKKIFGKAPRKQ